MTFVKKKIVKCKINIIIDANFIFKKIKKILTMKMIKKFATTIIKLNEKTIIFVFKQFIDEKFKKFIKFKKFALTNYRLKKIINVHII